MNLRELKSAALEFRRGVIGNRNSEMMCAVVCYPLQGWLSFLGEHLEVKEVDLGRCNHVFLTLPDGRVLDPTADQFGDYPKVYAGKPLWFHADRRGDQ